MPTNGELRITEAIRTLRAGGVKNRVDGVTDIIAVFKQNRNPGDLKSLKDPAYHDLFEALFKTAAEEKRLYRSAKTDTGRAKAERALAHCSEALRAGLRAGAEKLQQATVRAVIRNVTTFVSPANGDFDVASSQSYLKVLNTALEHESHVELLEISDWMATAEYCIDGLVHQAADPPSPGTPRGRQLPRSASSVNLLANIRKRNAEELMECLRSLVSASNAPISQATESIVTAIIGFLQSEGNIIGHFHHVGFAALNAVLFATYAEDTALFTSLVPTILSMISQLWSSKTAANDEMLNVSKDEMAMTFILLRLHMKMLISRSNDSETQNLLAAVQQAIRNDYEKRNERDQLQIDDLILSSGSTQESYKELLQCGHLFLRPTNMRGERRWAAVKVLAIVDELLHDVTSSEGDQLQDEADVHDLRHPRKRRRVARRLDAVIDDIKLGSTAARLAGLQTLLFALPGCELKNEELANSLEQLMPFLLDRDSNISGWTLICCAGLAQAAPSSAQPPSPLWLQIWKTISRIITSPTLGRPACHLLHTILAKNLVDFRDISDIATAMLTMPEINAPSAINDASLGFMRHILHFKNAEGSGGAASTSQSVLRWVFSAWNHSKLVSQRSYTTYQPVDVLNVLRVAIDLPPVRALEPAHAPGGYVRQTWIRHSLDEQTLRYVLQLPNSRTYTTECSHCNPSHALFESRVRNEAASHAQSTRRLLLDLLHAKVDVLQREWEGTGASNNSQMSSETVNASVAACVTSCIILPLVEDISSSKVDGIQRILQSITSSIRNFVGSIKDPKPAIAAILEIVHPYLPQTSTRGFHHLFTKFPELAMLINSLLPIVTGRHGQDNDLDIDDLMEMDLAFDSQQTRRSDRRKHAFERKELQLMLSPATIAQTTTNKMLLVSYYDGVLDDDTAVTSCFVDYLSGLSVPELLSCTQTIVDVLEGDLSLQPEDAVRLLEIVPRLLGPFHYTRCEVTVGLSIRLLAGLVRYWVGGEEGNLPEMALKLYSWFLIAVLSQPRPWPVVQRRLSDLVCKILQKEPTFGEAEGKPSIRTTLFEIIGKSPLLVKFNIAERVPGVFKLFVLNIHLNILDDLLPALPGEPDWLEGSAFRLYILSKLAAKWPTLLRTCTYYMLEVSGTVPRSTPYAAMCMKNLAADLSLENGKDVFRLFSSQFLFTWLSTDTFDNLPFGTFGYETLADLLIDSQEEITALHVMRDCDDEVARLAEFLNISVGELLKRSFTKVIAYSIAHDISVPPSQSAKKYVAGEVRVRKLLGKDEYFRLVNVHFVDIVSNLFMIMDHEQTLEKNFAKDNTLLQAAVALQQMKDLSSSTTTLTANQQPNFKAKYLIPELTHICGRTQFELSNLFTSTITTAVARNLLDMMNPAIGSLHNCSVLRKLRVLVSIAGESALSGYPLEMLLQSLRPLLLDSHCADDAMGMTQYLVEHGAAYLNTSPLFMAGLALSTLGSVRILLGESPSSTTQQTQYLETISKAHVFQSWFCRFVDDYKPAEFVKDTYRYAAFRSMMSFATRLGQPEPAATGTMDGELLMNILRDKRAQTGVLTRSARELALSLIYRDFQSPASFRNDILGEDDRAVRYAPTLWDVCKNSSASTPLVTWAATVFGRAFAASGFVEPSLLEETGLREIKGLVELDHVPQPTSRTYLLGLVRKLTLSNDRGTAGRAERALRRIVSGILDADTPDEAELSAAFPLSLIEASHWYPFHSPPSDLDVSMALVPPDSFTERAILSDKWIVTLVLHLIQSVPDDLLLIPLQKLVAKSPKFAEQCFPFVLHVVLLQQLDKSSVIKRQLSSALRLWFGSTDDAMLGKMRLLINAILYLRTQPVPHEKTIVERDKWLDVDFKQAAEAAVRCKMFKTALLFTELAATDTPALTRQPSVVVPTDARDVLASIFKNLDDPDIFYGIRQVSNLNSLAARLEFERNGMKTLMFKGAQYDTLLRRGITPSDSESHSLVNAMGMMSLDGISHSLLQNQRSTLDEEDAVSRMYHTARKLEQWDLPIPDMDDGGVITTYKTFQLLSSSLDRSSAQMAINTGLSTALTSLLSVRSGARPVHASLQALAACTEVDEVMSSASSEQFEEMLQRFENRSKWMKTGKFEDVSQVISCRETILSCLNRQPSLRKLIGIGLSDTSLVEARVSLLSSNINRVHGSLQEALTSATYVNSLIEPCRALGLNIEAAAGLEVADAMWDQGEMSSSIGLLKELEVMPNLADQTIPVNKAVILAKLSSQIAEAKLQKPDYIMEKYLHPAMVGLDPLNDPIAAGEVFRTFAVFCDRQYQDQDGKEDLERLRVMKDSKEEEVRTLMQMVRDGNNKTKLQADKKAWDVAKKWLKMDKEEYESLLESRNQLLMNCLENYLLSLTHWDAHDNDAIRFTALWMEHADDELATEAVAENINGVPTHKFAALANQLTSRLSDNSTNQFQMILHIVVGAICTDHPYHGMYQVWAGAHASPKKEDEVAVMRQKATTQVAKDLAKHAKAGDIWRAIEGSNNYYVRFAAEKEKYKGGMKIKVSNSPGAIALERSFRNYKVPPPTMQFPLSVNNDYSNLPVMTKLDPTFTIASGISAPKIMTVIASDGKRYRQLVKGGSDDLRQDAIMEQVFGLVDDLLKENSATRQRNLGIRTYKVVPLNSTAGIIEFVPHTIPLQEYLMPAHTKYYPKDISNAQARKDITDVSQQKAEARIKKYRAVTDRFHPVLRYFHLERFPDPDEWFAKRQAYTRSTAAISMLGYVLGLGDRHGHNILLDEVSGEAVHIDLGVAFEMGRILPVPETIPFRLTRDIVDGMGITKTEGVFRRCCEFTMDALRKEADTIMTILDVLRYDPLYTWSISPVRLAKLQDAQSAVPISTAGSTTTGTGNTTGGKVDNMNEPSEADRALTVVRKKLSKGLSVTAMVNDLINQATDERNLALLYSGWAAYS